MPTKTNKGTRVKSVATQHRKVYTRTWNGPIKVQTSTGSVLSFREFVANEDPLRDWVTFVYTKVQPSVIRGKKHKDFCGLLGKELRMARKDVEFFLNRRIWTVL